MSTGLSLYVADWQFRQSVSDRLSGLPASWITGSMTYDPPSIANGAETTTTVTVTGAALGQIAFAAFSLNPQGIKITANVSAADTVTVTLRNDTGLAIDLASGTLTAAVLVP